MIARNPATKSPSREESPEKRPVAARIEQARLSVLAPLRDHPGLRVAPNQPDGMAWLRWPKADPEVLRLLRPVPGIELFSHESGIWRRLGSRLPAECTPPALDDMAPLAAVLLPLPVFPEPPRESWRIGALRLVSAETPRRATALLTTGRQLIEWADTAVSSELAQLQAAWSGDRVLLIGPRLPWTSGSRFWGSRILTPLGLEPDPLLPEAMLAEALGLESDEFALLTPEASGPPCSLQAEAVPREAFRPLTRAGLRLAVRNEREVSP